VKCGTSDGVSVHEKQLGHIPPGYWVLLIFCLPVALLLIARSARGLSLDVPLCSKCDERWAAVSRARSYVGTAVLASVLVLLLARLPQEGLIAGVFVLLALIGAAVAALGIYARARMISMTACDDAIISLAHVHPSAVDAACSLSDSARPG
jgi:hypothetical protein